MVLGHPGALAMLAASWLDLDQARLRPLWGLPGAWALCCGSLSHCASTERFSSKKPSLPLREDESPR